MENLSLISRSIPEMFFKRVERSSDRVAYMYKDTKRNVWIRTTWKQFGQHVKDVACALIKSGFKPRDKLSIMGNTRPEWGICDLAALSAGGTSVGIYQTLSPSQVEYIIKHSDSRFVFVENREMLEKVLKVRQNLSLLEKIIVWNENDVMDDPQVTSFRSFKKLGREAGGEKEIARRVAAIQKDDIATIIYTSGTTGPPKGAQISHGNVLAFLSSWKDAIDLRPEDISLHFLPMAHAAEKNAGFYGRINVGLTCAYASSIEALLDELQEIRPTMFGSVPRMFEKAYDRIFSQVAQASAFRQKIFRWAEKLAREKVRKEERNEPLSQYFRAQYALADRLVFRRIRNVLGGRIRICVVGAAPIAREILEFFHGIGLPIYEGYGLTEATVISHINREGEIKLTTVGKPIDGLEHRIAEDGEILLRGPTVFKGYYKDEKATREAIDPDGWLHTGDIGTIDEEGYLRITDRKKHLIITSGGKNIAPANIENAIKTNPLISHVHVHGDRRPYLTALITLAEDELKLFAEQRGLDFNYAELTTHPEVVEKVKQIVFEANQQLSRVEWVRKFRLLNRDLSIEHGEITPTLKVRRKTIEQKFARLFDEMYEGKAGLEVVPRKEEKQAEKVA